MIRIRLSRHGQVQELNACTGQSKWSASARGFLGAVPALVKLRFGGNAIIALVTLRIKRQDRKSAVPALVTLRVKR